MENEKYKNHGKSWDENDELILERLARRGISLEIISQALERSPNAVFLHVVQVAYPEKVDIDSIF